MMSFFVMCSWYEEWRVCVMGGELLGGVGGYRMYRRWDNKIASYRKMSTSENVGGL